MGSRSNAPPKKPIMAPPGPPRRSQSSITSSQPAPTMLPKPNVKYSSAPRVRRRLVGGNSKLFLQRGETLREAELTGRAGWRRGLELVGPPGSPGQLRAEQLLAALKEKLGVT